MVNFKLSAEMRKRCDHHVTSAGQKNLNPVRNSEPVTFHNTARML